jgi:hypothetical protein
MGKPLPQNSRLPSTHGLGKPSLSIDHNIKDIMRCTTGFQLVGLKICQLRITAVLRTFSDLLEATCIDLYTNTKSNFTSSLNLVRVETES